MVETRLQAIQTLETTLKLTKNADHLLLHFTDILGLLKGRTIPADQAKTALTQGIPFDGSSINGGVNIEESDMTMKPDPTTFTVCPYYFYDKSVATFICDITTPDGEPFANDPRYILKKVTQKIRQEGYEPTAAAELEFYLVKRTRQSTIEPVENHIADKQRYFDNAPGRDLTEPYRMDLSQTLSAMGITVERQHHEVGSAQNEVTIKYSDPQTTSDNITKHKFAAKAIADKKYGWTATFMPKPWMGRAGSGMHIHIGLVDLKTGRNPLYDPDSYANISQKGRYFIGGILDHARALSALAASTVNSYKRLVPGYEAPVYVAWSRRNRSALVRIPAFTSEKEARVEFRCPDPLCNSYLVYAAVFEAGVEGIKKKIDPGDAVDINLYHLSEIERKKLRIKMLPTSLKEALEEWKSDGICVTALGKETAEAYVALKTREWAEYAQHAPKSGNEVTEWEIEKYLYA
ncbi:type I glutamate--ammonia ligase [Candidatus Bathyarchaeota archaeon]|nr:type I glutamate--ammonia ligase [Candidatus Bathyarchaeota archaeon]